MFNRETELSQQEETKSSNQLINIEGLRKEDVLVALFKNVYKKSSSYDRAWMFLADSCYFDGANPVGMDFPPTAYEARQILWSNKNKFVDYVGPVLFKIDFSCNIIDTKNYDKNHETATNPKVKTAKDCIDQLRHDFEIAQRKEAEEKATAKDRFDQLLHNFTIVHKKEFEEEKAKEEKKEKLMNTANELIRKILTNDNCKLADSHFRTLDFNLIQNNPLKHYKNMQKR